MLALASLTTIATADDLADLMAEAQRAFARGDFAAAKTRFEIVRKMEPGNKTAISYLKRIAADEAAEIAKQRTGNATQAALQKLVMEKVELRESSLSEALEFLKQKGNTLGGGKVAINFVLQLDEQTQATKITLTLQKVPFSEVLRYIGDLANVQFVYEQFAIVVKPKGAAPAPQANAAEAPGAIKIPGLNDAPR